MAIIAEAIDDDLAPDLRAAAHTLRDASLRRRVRLARRAGAGLDIDRKRPG